MEEKKENEAQSYGIEWGNFKVSTNALLVLKWPLYSLTIVVIIIFAFVHLKSWKSNQVFECCSGKIGWVPTNTQQTDPYRHQFTGKTTVISPTTIIKDVEAPLEKNVHSPAFDYLNPKGKIEYDEKHINIALKFMSVRKDNGNMYPDEVVGTGEIINGYSIVRYHGWKSTDKSYHWYGAMYLKVQPMSNITGYWVTSHEITGNQKFAIGYIEFDVLNELQ